MHEPSGLASFETRGGSSLSKLEPSTVLDSSRLESLGTQLLAAQTGVDKPTRAPCQLHPVQTGVHKLSQTLDKSLGAVLGGFFVARADLSQLESSSGLGSSLKSTVPRAEPAQAQVWTRLKPAGEQHYTQDIPHLSP